MHLRGLERPLVYVTGGESRKYPPIAFPLAFTVQNDIFSGSLHHCKIIGQTFGAQRFTSGVRCNGEPTTKNWGGLG